MRSRHSQEQRRFTRAHKPDSMMQQYTTQRKFLRRGLGNQFHLMLRHHFVRFIIDPLDLIFVFQLSDGAPEIHDRPGVKIGIVATGRGQFLFSHQNFTNGVCHRFKSLVSFYSCAASRKETQNEHESM